MKVVGVTCPGCGDFVYSRARHDMRHCSCKRVATDGGQASGYVRMVGDGEQEERYVPHTLDAIVRDWSSGEDKLGIIPRAEISPDGTLFNVELRRVRTGLSKAVEKYDRVRKDHEAWEPVMGRLLTAHRDVLCGTFLWLSDAHGWPMLTTLLERLEFVSQFVSYHIMDDGDPGVWAQRYLFVGESRENAIEGPSVLVLGVTEHGGRHCFICKNREVTISYEEVGNDRWMRSIIQGPEQVLAVLDYHERVEARRLEWAKAENLEQHGTELPGGEDSIKDPIAEAFKAWLESR